MGEWPELGKGLHAGAGCANAGAGKTEHPFAVAKDVVRRAIATGADCLLQCPWFGMCRIVSRLKGQHVSTGTVKWFNETKGYGFITPDQGGSDVFVHISAVERSGLRGLNEGQKISYDLEADRKTGKSAAVNLKTA